MKKTNARNKPRRREKQFFTKAGKTGSWGSQTSSSREIVVRINVDMQVLPILFSDFDALFFILKIISTGPDFP